MHKTFFAQSLRRIGTCSFLLAALSAHAADLTVSAAASLTNAFNELGAAFEAQHPGTKVLLNFAGSGNLLAQIAKGAPADVFASADQETMDKAEAQKLLAAGSRRNFATNALLLITPIDSSLSFKVLSDLGQPGVKRFAIGNPASVPAGRYTKGALEAASQWGAVEARAVNVQNVRQALDYVARGEVEAGFVYATDAYAQKGKVKIAATVPTATPISYPIAAIAGSPNAGDATKFIEYVLSAAGQAALARHGFQKP